ncbi:MAG: hypothetical protein AAB875_02075 [Patescibacteria group bacterium]
MSSCNATNEKREQAEREAKAAADREAAALAPDREKLVALAATLRGLSLPTFSTAPGHAAGKKVAEQIEKMAAWVAKTGAAL